MISLSPLPSAHPSCFQPTLVRTSIGCYTDFILAKDRSSRFASIPSDSIALFRLAFASARLRLTLHVRITSRLIKQEARRQAYPGKPGHCPPTACKHTVSGSISLPSQGCFSPFPHGTGSLSVAREYLALESGLPSFPPDYTCPVVLRMPLRVRSAFGYMALTFFGSAFQQVHLAVGLITLLMRSYNPHV